MKKTIKQYSEDLQVREAQLRNDLANNEEILREKSKTIGQVALIGGLATLTIFWGYKTFSGESEKSKSKKRKKKGKRVSMSSRLSPLFTPYIVKVLSNLLQLEDSEENSKKDPTA